MSELPDGRTVLRISHESLSQEYKRIQRLLEPYENHPLGEYIKLIQYKFGDTQGKIDEALLVIDQAIKDEKAPLDAAWGKYLELKLDLMPSLSSELLAVIGGIYLIEAKLDYLRGSDGSPLADDVLTFSDIAQTLVKDLGDRSVRGWAGVLIVGEERLGHSMAEIIRLRFPACDIWHLPFTAHEYGYMVAKLRPPEQFTQFKIEVLGKFSREETARSKQQDTILCRLFADAFATCFVGPAYIYALLHLRFIHGETLYKPSDAMPAFAHRFVFALEILKWMNQEPLFKPDHSPLINDEDAKSLFDNEVNEQAGIRLLWRETIKVINQGADLYDVIAEEYEPWLNEIKQILRAFKSSFKSTRDNWLIAQELKSNLTIYDMKVDAIPTSMWAILNAAWSARWDNPSMWETIQHNAVGLLRKDPAMLNKTSSIQAAKPTGKATPYDEADLKIVTEALYPTPALLEKFEKMVKSSKLTLDEDILTVLGKKNRDAYDAYVRLPNQQP